MRAGQIIVAGLLGTAMVLSAVVIFDAITAWFIQRFALMSRRAKIQPDQFAPSDLP